MSGEIILDFDETDSPVITVKGVKGTSCKTLTRELERALGAVTSDEHTKELWETERNEQRVQNRS